MARDAYATIQKGSGVSVQGIFVREESDGRVVVAVGEKEYTGIPVAPPNQKETSLDTA